MQKFSVSTSKGFIHTNDFRSAMKILQMDYEEKKRKIEEEKKKKESQPKDWQSEFEKLLEQYTPKTPEEARKMKYEGGDDIKDVTQKVGYK